MVDPKTLDRRVAILIVNGGRDPDAGRWLELGLERLQSCTRWSDYHLYIWNNNVEDRWVAECVQSLPQATLVTADPQQTLAHRHAVPLQRLYELARKEGAAYIITLDSDAFPVRTGWLAELLDELDAGCVMAGIWMDETESGIRPYVHPSCLATTVDYIEANGLRLDYVGPKGKVKQDTLSHFTAIALGQGLTICRLRRSNQNEVHRIIGGIYGDLIYHHGAGSRPGAQFWDEPKDAVLNRRNMEIRDLAAKMLFQYTEDYLAWLRGAEIQPPEQRNTRQKADKQGFDELLARWTELANSEIQVTLGERIKFRFFRLVGYIPKPIRLTGRRTLRQVGLLGRRR